MFPIKIFLSVFLLVFILGACRGVVKTASVLAESCETDISQGITGSVVVREGNWMPGPDINPERNEKGVAREIHIYELTRVSQTTPSEEGVFFSHIKTRLIKKVSSGRDGCFKVFLPVGRYSLFVMEEGKLFANRFDGEMYIFPALVEAGNLTPVQIVIDHRASY